MRDCYHERDTGICYFEERDSGNNHFKRTKNRDIRRPENVWRTWSSQSTKSTRCTGSLAFKRRSGWSATLFNYCVWMKILSEAKLPVYQKCWMAHKVTWHLRLLRQLKCLTALKTPSKCLNSTDMAFVTCWAVWQLTGRIYARLYITKINLSRC